MNELLRVGVIGLGFIGRTHLNAIRGVPEIELVGVTDRNMVQAQEVGREFGTQVFPDVDALLASDIDAVLICTPTGTHRELALQAKQAGKHVFLEKPLALTLEDGQAILNAFEGGPQILMVGHVVRFFAEYEAAKGVLDSGELGTVPVARASRLNSYPGTEGSWYRDPAQSGGVVHDMLLHDLDFLRWCFGDVARVFARIERSDDLPNELALVTLRFKNGTMAHAEGHWGSARPFRYALELAGTRNLLKLSSDAQPIFVLATHEGGTSASFSAGESPYAKQMRHFAAVVRGEMPPRVTPHDALAALQIALAARESAETRKPVTLGEIA